MCKKKRKNEEKYRQKTQHRVIIHDAKGLKIRVEER